MDVRLRKSAILNCDKTLVLDGKPQFILLVSRLDIPTRIQANLSFARKTRNFCFFPNETLFFVFDLAIFWKWWLALAIQNSGLFNETEVLFSTSKAGFMFISVILIPLFLSLSLCNFRTKLSHFVNSLTWHEGFIGIKFFVKVTLL